MLRSLFKCKFENKKQQEGPINAHLAAIVLEITSSVILLLNQLIIAGGSLCL